jgi:tetratricopeptide (TPR) repeat protein
MRNVESVDPDYEKADGLEADGSDLFSKGEHNAALEAFSEAARIFGRLQSSQTDEYLKYRFASAVNNTGCAHLGLGAMEPAREAFIRSANLFGQPWSRNSTRSDFGNDFAAALNNLGHVLAFTDKPQTAVQFFVESLRIREEVRSSFPGYIKANEGLWNTADLLGDLYEKLGNPSKAVDIRGRAKRLRHTPGPWFAGVGQTINEANEIRCLPAASSLTPDQWAEQMRERLALADYLFTQRLYAEAIETYSELVHLFRSEAAQVWERLEADRAIPAEIRSVEAKRQMATLLDRLATAYGAIGDRARELKYLREQVDCLSDAANLAEGDIRTSLEEHLRQARMDLRAKEGMSFRHE